jgi:hypothetical protein
MPKALFKKCAKAPQDCQRGTGTEIEVEELIDVSHSRGRDITSGDGEIIYLL